jgi:hypothetical protein
LPDKWLSWIAAAPPRAEVLSRKPHFQGMANRRPPIPRYLLTQCLLGLAVALMLPLIILATDTGSIATLVAASTEPVTAIVILAVRAITTIVPLVIATAIGRLALRDAAVAVETAKTFMGKRQGSAFAKK